MTGKTAIFIVFFASAIAFSARSEAHMNYSVVGIEYIGPSDKPITPLVISDSKEGAEWYRTKVLKRSALEFTDVHVVNISLMTELLANAESYRRVAEREKKLKSHGTVSITVITPQTRTTFLLETKSGLSLLKAFENHCTHEQSLYADLVNFQNRITH